MGCKELSLRAPQRQLGWAADPIFLHPGTGLKCCDSLTLGGPVPQASNSTRSLWRRRQYKHFKNRRTWSAFLHGRQGTVMVVLGAAGTCYYVTHLQEVPYTHRRHAIFVSPQTEVALGLATYAQVL